MSRRRSAAAWLTIALLAAAGAAAAAEEEPVAWPRAPVDEGRGQGALPVDLSVLNAAERPAGRRGRVLAVGRDLRFEDGTPARFWGVNLQANALFRTPPAQIAAHAKRLSRLGVNLVRIHHHDSHWVRPNIFGNRDKGRPGPTTGALDERAMLSLHRWVAALKAEGIYLWIDLHVGRRFSAADGVALWHEMPADRGWADPRGFAYVNAEIEGRMRAAQARYLSHVSPLSGVALKDEPAVIAVLITNENDITAYFGNRLLPGKGAPEHARRLRAEAEAFAASHGLAAGVLMRPWEHGPVKLFLNDLQHRFDARMTAHLRALGYPGLVATTSHWGRGRSLSGLPALSAGDLIDVHHYARPGDLDRDPAAGEGPADMAAWIAASQVEGMPLTVSEWNLRKFPADDRAAAPIAVAAAASLQGWDALMLYGYAQQPLDGPGGPRRPGQWDAAGDPALLATLPAAALMFRAGHLAEAARAYRLTPGPALFAEKITPETGAIGAAIRGLAWRSRVSVALPEAPELPWLAPAPAEAGAIPLDAAAAAALAESWEEGPIRSDTGEITRDPAAGILTVDTGLSQAAIGRIGGREIRLGDVTIRLATPWAAVAVQSLDGRPIGDAGRLMVTAMARARPSAGRRLPYRVEPVAGEIEIRRAAGAPLGIEAGGASGLRLEQSDGALRLTLPEGRAGGVIVLSR